MFLIYQVRIFCARNTFEQYFCNSNIIRLCDPFIYLSDNRDVLVITTHANNFCINMENGTTHVCAFITIAQYLTVKTLVTTMVVYITLIFF